MAIVMLAGLVSSTFLVLFYTPAFFWHWCGPIVPKLIRDSSENRVNSKDPDMQNEQGFS
jgi:hypothetical protein